LDIKQGVIKQYPIAFGEQSEERGNEFGGNFAERWGWYPSFIRIARELGIHIREVGKEPIHESLTLLSYLIDEANEEQKELKKHMKR
jgi:hypothetical protein